MKNIVDTGRPRTRSARVRQLPGLIVIRSTGFAFAVVGVFLVARACLFPSSTDLPAEHSLRWAKVAQSTTITKPIQEIQLGERVLGTNPQRVEVDATIPEPDKVTWRRIHLQLTRSDGTNVSIHLLRPASWIEKYGVFPRTTFFLDMPEMGAVGNAHVLEVGPCPPIKEGEGNVVTGKFVHDSPSEYVIKLTFPDDEVMASSEHPFWSEERRRFVPASTLKKGECVLTVHGPVTVQAVALIRYNALLYNIETHNEHVYYVGQQGVLVHNFCLYRPFYDSVGRLRAVVARITQADLRTGTGTSVAARRLAKSLGLQSDDAGHLIARVLGGPGGARSRNIFPQLARANRGAMAQVEKKVRELVEAGHHVIVRVSLRYSGNSARPDRVIYQIRRDGRLWKTFRIAN